MPRIPRKLLIDFTEAGVYHCITRGVQRAFLCGVDALTGRWLRSSVLAKHPAKRC